MLCASITIFNYSLTPICSSPITNQYICFNKNFQIEVASLYLKCFYDNKFVV